MEKTNNSLENYLNTAVKLIDESGTGIDRSHLEIVREIYSEHTESIISISNKKAPTKESVEDPSKLYELNSKIQAEKDKFSDVKIRDFNIFPTINEGDKYFEIRNLKQLSDDKVLDLTHKKGKILVLEFWATWCGPCQLPMQKFQDFLTTHGEEIKDKVDIMAIGYDKPENLKKRISDKSWNLINHVYTELAFRHPSASIYGVNGIPMNMIIDTEGTIVYKGHPLSIDIEKKILCLAKGEPDNQKSKKEVEPEEKNIVVLPEVDPLVSIFRKHQEAHNLLDLKYHSNFHFRVKEKFNFTDKLEIFDQKFQTLISYRIENENIKLDLEKDLQALLKDDFSKLSVNFKLLKTVDISPGTECSKCKISFATHDFHYFSYFSNLYFCKTCGNEVDELYERIHRNRFKVRDNLIRIPASLKSSVTIDLYKFGSNSITKEQYDELELEIQHYASCNGCPKPLIGERYICLTCRPGDLVNSGFCDLCSSCIDLASTNDEFIYKMNNPIKGSKEFHEKDHIYIMLRFNNEESYYDY